MNIFGVNISSEAEYLLGVNIFHEWIFFRGECFSEATIFSGVHISRANIF